ncbi:MAG TPA: histone deacetylase [Solirubrobacterales bacterium]|nr:histone deacetylase [Solirubrobacterales bacterium]
MGLYFRHPSSLEHDTGSHPECADRIRAIEAAMDDAGWPAVELREPGRASREQLARVHTDRHIGAVEALCSAGGGMVDADTVAVEASWEASLRAAGAAVEAVDALMAGDGGFAFCAMRPPGHHAESDRAMGFCLFNSIAVGAAHAIAAAGAERVLILDWDVHHGNGTAEIFAGSDRVLFASLHQSPLYPGTGHPGEMGNGAGDGYTINLPVPPGADGKLFLALVQQVVAPVAREFRPDLIAISSGYDAHADDPLANCELTDVDYASLAATTRELGAELAAPVLVCLEGGYDLGVLSRTVPATVRALDDSLPPEQADPGLAAPAREHFRRHWSNALA